jgi:hypothetical protein
VFGKSLIPWQRKKTMTMESEIFARTTSRRRRFTAGWVGARVEELKVGKIIFFLALVYLPLIGRISLNSIIFLT